MNNLIFRTFVKDWENVKDAKVRDSYGKLAGIVGIISNTLLCLHREHCNAGQSFIYTIFVVQSSTFQTSVTKSS